MAGTIEDFERTVSVVTFREWASRDRHLGSRGAVRVLHSSLWSSQPRRASISVSWKVWVGATQKRSSVLLVRGYTEN